MAAFVAHRIEEAYDKGGLEAGREKYEAYFVRTRLYRVVRADVDTILDTDGYGDCISDQ